MTDTIIQECWFNDPDGITWKFTLYQTPEGHVYKCTDWLDQVIAVSPGMRMGFDEWVGAMVEGAVRFSKVEVSDGD